MTDHEHHPPAPAPSPGSGFGAPQIILIVLGAVGLLVVVPCAFLIVGIALPALGQARQTAMQLQSSTHARGIALGLTLYQDTHGEMPPLDNWAALLVAEDLISPDMLVAPGGNPGQTAYFYVPMPDGAVPGQHVLVYEHPDAVRGGGTVVFADTSGTFIEDPEYLEMIGSFTLPDGTPYAPHEDVELPEP